MVTAHATVTATARAESRWPAAGAVAAAAAVHLSLPTGLTLGQQYLLPGLEAVLLAAVLVANPRKLTVESRDARILSLVLVLVVASGNAAALSRLVDAMLHGHGPSGRSLILSAAGIWVINVLVFALTYWELDRGGPHARSTAGGGRADLLFPQEAPWAPAFLDYLYVAYTNSTAFSPTDTMPLTWRLKTLMMVQSSLALVTLAIVAGRAVNILG